MHPFRDISEICPSRTNSALLPAKPRHFVSPSSRLMGDAGMESPSLPAPREYECSVETGNSSPLRATESVRRRSLRTGVWDLPPSNEDQQELDAPSALAPRLRSWKKGRQWLKDMGANFQNWDFSGRFPRSDSRFFADVNFFNQAQRLFSQPPIG